MKSQIKMLYDIDFIIRAVVTGFNRTGVYFVTYNLLKEFENDERFEVILTGSDRHFNEVVKSDAWLSQFKAIPYGTKINTKKNGERVIPNLRINYKNYDCYFHPCGSEMPSIPLKGYGILHDIIVVLFPSFFNRAEIYIEAYKKNLTKNNTYFCPSENTRCDVLKYFKEYVDESHLYIAPIAVSKPLKPSHDIMNFKKLIERYSIAFNEHSKYIFYLGNITPHKGVGLSINYFMKFVNKYGIDDLYFFVAGDYWDMDPDQVYAIEKNGFQDKIIRLGYVPDEDVEILYGNALWFVYLSEYEGFGIPLLEAMRCGTPVLTSNRASLPEVAGDAALLVHPHDEKSCIEAFKELYFNDAKRLELSAKGIVQERKFSWSKTKNAIADVIIKDFNTCQ